MFGLSFLTTLNIYIRIILKMLGYFFFTPKFYLGTTYLFSNTTNKLLGFSKYFLLYYYVNHKCFISHYLNWVMI